MEKQFGANYSYNELIEIIDELNARNF